MPTYALTTTPQAVATAGRRYRFSNAGSQDAHLTWGGGTGAERLLPGRSVEVTPSGDVSAETATGTTDLVVVSGQGVDTTSASRLVRGGTA